MTFDQFLEVIKDELIDTDPAEVTENAHFKDMEEWSSLIVMILITRLDDDFNVKLTRANIESSSTLKDLYQSISANEN